MLIATNVYQIYAARFVCGFIGGGLYVLTVYFYIINEKFKNKLFISLTVSLWCRFTFMKYLMLGNIYQIYSISFDI